MARRTAKKRLRMDGRVYGTQPVKREYTEAEREAWKARKRAEADAAVSDILEMFTTGELPGLVAQTMIVRAEGTSPITNWSLGNQLLCLRAGTTDARGFAQWKGVGRSVKKGAKAFRIMAPTIKKETREDAETGETTERSALVGYRLIPVFRLQDTEGLALTSPVDYVPDDLPPLYDVAARLGVSVAWVPQHELADFRGAYWPGRREIVLLTHDARVFLHELAHAAHDRVLRDAGRGTLSDMATVDAEVVADTVAATLCHLYDLDGFVGHAAEYIEHYAGGNPGRAAMKVLSDVQNVLYLLLDPPEWSAVAADTRELVAA